MKEDWIECALEEISEKITKGSTPTTYGYEYQKQGVNFIKIENVKNGKIDLKSIYQFISEEAHNSQKRSQLKEGDVLFSIAGTIGETCLITSKDLPANTNQAFAIISGFNKVLDSNFLRKQFDSFVSRKVKSKARGGAMNNVSLTDLKQMHLIVPPLIEQQAIVNKIEALFSSLDSGIADLKKAQDQLKIYRQAVLKKAFEGELTKEWREKQTDLPTADELLEQIKEERQKHYDKQISDWKEAVKVWNKSDKTSNRPNKPKKNTNIDTKFSINPEHLKYLGQIPSSWSKVHIAFITANEPNSIVDGPFGASINVAEDYVEKGVPVIRINNILPYQYSKSKLKYIREEKFVKLRRHNILSGDVLLSKVGTIGNSCIYPHSEPEGMLSTTWSSRIRVDDNVITNKFFSILLNSKKQALNTIASAAVQAFLNMTTIKNFPIPFMSLREQHQIVQEIESRLSVCDAVEQSITESLEKAQALRQSILKKAFEGKLLTQEEIAKCKAHKDYEPASALLERIKREKVK